MDKEKILIVDDDPQLRRGLDIRFRANQYDTAHASDGVSAISMARKETPDLIILDLGLPAGDGFTVMERLQAFADLACVPVIVVTARDPRTNRQRALQAGAVAFFQKPVDNEELLAAIQQALRASPTELSSTGV